MGNQQGNTEYVMTLEDNAFSSLEHGIEHYLLGSDTDIKFMVLHVFHAVELLLKARLAKEHPLLLLSKPEEDPEKGHTADYLVVVKRLKNVGVHISRDNLEILDNLRASRNKIEHYKIRAKREDIEKYVGGAIKLLDDFVKKELRTHLRDHIKPEIFQEMMKTLYTYEERQKRLKERMESALPIGLKNQDHYKKVTCASCNEDAIWAPDPQIPAGKVHCYNCNAEFKYKPCSACGKPIVYSWSGVKNGNLPDMTENTCASCWNDMAENMQ